MFSNKHAVLKLVIALGLFFLVSKASDRDFRNLNPEFWICQTDPIRYDGRYLFVSMGIASQSRADGFEIMFRENRIWVKRPDNAPMPKVNEMVTFTGTFHRDNFIQADRVHVHTDNRWKRGAMFLVSAAVLGWLLIRFLRLFKMPPAQGVFFLKEKP